MSIDTAVNVVMAWCAVMTVLGGIVTAVSRTIRKRIQHALKDVQDRLGTAEKDLRAMRVRYKVVLRYARRLYDMMKTQGLEPPTPPDELFD